MLKNREGRLIRELKSNDSRVDHCRVSSVVRLFEMEGARLRPASAGTGEWEAASFLGMFRALLLTGPCAPALHASESRKR